mmetsp:Transcript_42706/g.125236  ORF Transcript_42706/g.125236 Transcript_42706/m.125236 type:complete len:256 (-) Transcript_42706:5206-5973(-)
MRAAPGQQHPKSVARAALLTVRGARAAHCATWELTRTPKGRAHAGRAEVATTARKERRRRCRAPLAVFPHLKASSRRRGAECARSGPHAGRVLRSQPVAPLDATATNQSSRAVNAQARAVRGISAWRAAQAAPETPALRGRTIPTLVEPACSTASRAREGRTRRSKAREAPSNAPPATISPQKARLHANRAQRASTNHSGVRPSASHAGQADIPSSARRTAASVPNITTAHPPMCPRRSVQRAMRLWASPANQMQ